MFLKHIQIRHAILDELRPYQLTAIMPLIQIGHEDRIAEELAPVFVEWFALAVVGELRGKDRFDILGVRGEDAADAARGAFDSVALTGEETLPAFEVSVFDCVLDGSIDEVDVCGLVLVNDWVEGEGRVYPMVTRF